MRAVILYSLFAIAALATPIAIELEGGKRLEKRGTDSVIAHVVKALLTFGAFIWGGGIISRRAINYYFERKADLEGQRMANNMRMNAAYRKVKPMAVKKPSADPTVMDDPPDYEAVMAEDDEISYRF
jgi:hypothetical protein